MKLFVKALKASLVLSIAFPTAVLAKEIKTNTAQMQAMDKVTGRVKVIEVPVNGNVNFGTFSILVRDCQTRPPEETPENYAFVDVLDNNTDGTKVNIFRGWMMSSTPSLNAVEHPIYDVWLLKCIDTIVDEATLLTKEELDERNSIQAVADNNLENTGEPISLLKNIEENQPIEDIDTVLEGENSTEGIIVQTVEEANETSVIINEDVLVNHNEETPVNLMNINDSTESSSAPAAEEEKTKPISSLPAINNDNKIIVKGLVPDNIETPNVIFENTLPESKNIDSENINNMENVKTIDKSIESNLLNNIETQKNEENSKSNTPSSKDENFEFDMIY